MDVNDADRVRWCHTPNHGRGYGLNRTTHDAVKHALVFHRVKAQTDDLYRAAAPRNASARVQIKHDSDLRVKCEASTADDMSGKCRKFLIDIMRSCHTQLYCTQQSHRSGALDLICGDECCQRVYASKYARYDLCAFKAGTRHGDDVSTIYTGGSRKH